MSDMYNKLRRLHALIVHVSSNNFQELNHVVVFHLHRFPLTATASNPDNNLPTPHFFYASVEYDKQNTYCSDTRCSLSMCVVR